MDNIVNKDLRWGLVGVCINKTWIRTSAEELVDGDDDYDFNIEISTWREDEILRELSGLIEECINKGKYDDIGDFINNAILEYAQLYQKTRNYKRKQRCLPVKKNKKKNKK